MNSLVSVIIKVVGSFLIMISWYVGYTLAIINEFHFQDVFHIQAKYYVWAIYLVSQFFGLYLMGYGQKLNIASLQKMGIYLTSLFLICASTLVLASTNKIDIEINQNIILLTIINFSGILILLWSERFSDASEEKQINSQLSGADKPNFNVQEKLHVKEASSDGHHNFQKELMTVVSTLALALFAYLVYRYITK